MKVNILLLCHCVKIKRTVVLLVVSIMLLLFNTSCEEEGACEVKIEANGYIYSCREEKTETFCSNYPSSSESVFHEGKSCASLGYPYKSSTTDAYTAKPDDFSTPGKDGAFAGSSGSAGAGCDDYNGPTFDIQIDSQCQAAYAYSCSGVQQGVDAACAIYKSYQKNNPSIPNCPYCK